MCSQWGTVGEWVGGLAGAVAVGVTVWQIRKHQTERLTEVRDAEKTQARTIVAKVRAVGKTPGGSAKVTGATLINGSSQPVSDLEITIKQGEIQLANKEALVLLPGPHEVDMAGGEFDQRQGDIDVEMSFKDARGLRWRKLNDNEPDRIIR